MTRYETFSTESDSTIREKLDHAIGALMEQDAALLTQTATERSISFRLAIHLQAVFPDWNVDCEYNVWGTPWRRIKAKHISPTSNSADTEACTAYPDIVIHRRGSDEKLMIIELKKSTNKLGRHQDIKKITAYKTEHAFQHAFYLDIGVEKDLGDNTVDSIP